MTFAGSLPLADFIKLAIDDFGTGYLSLAHLKWFPIDKLKIDQSFLKNLHESDIDANIVKTVIDWRHSLNLSVIAEGVEADKFVEWLLDFIGKP